MASTYTTDLRLEKMANGENSATWGTKTNTSLDLIEQAVAGVASVAMTDAEYTLTTSNGASDEARNMVITMTGTLTGAQNVIVPSVDKLYVIKNSTTGGYSIVVKTAAGTGITILNGETEQLYCDATNVLLASTTHTGTGAPVRASLPSIVTTIGVGGATASSSGAGVSFPATQAASTDVNTLDDYEEGTWTPAVTCASVGDMVVAYPGGRSGVYTKVGNMVVAHFSLANTTLTYTTATGALRLSGFPFTTGGYGVGALVWGGITKAGYTAVSPIMISTYAQFYASGSGASAAFVQVTDVASGASLVLYGTVTYFV